MSNRDVIYSGRRPTDERQPVIVLRDGKPFDPRPSLKVRNHSPNGFEWGYGGSGPSQLALAILLDTLGQAEAERHYHDFKFQVIAALPKKDDWSMTGDWVLTWWWGRQNPLDFLQVLDGAREALAICRRTIDALDAASIQADDAYLCLTGMEDALTATPRGGNSIIV